MSDDVEKQNPLTVVPNAAIFMLQAMLATLAHSSPGQVKEIRGRLEKQRTTSLGASNPGSYALLDAMFKDLPEGWDV